MQVKVRPGSEVIKLFSCSTQLSTKLFLLMNVKMPTIVGILTFMSWKYSILGSSEPKQELSPDSIARLYRCSQSSKFKVN